jgi:hypothetical protein
MDGYMRTCIHAYLVIASNLLVTNVDVARLPLSLRTTSDGETKIPSVRKLQYTNMAKTWSSRILMQSGSAPLQLDLDAFHLTYMYILFTHMNFTPSIMDV